MNDELPLTNLCSVTEQSTLSIRSPLIVMAFSNARSVTCITVRAHAWNVQPMRKMSNAPLVGDYDCKLCGGLGRGIEYLASERRAK